MLQLDKSMVSQGGRISARVFDGTSRPFSTDLALKVRMLHDGKATRVPITENGVPVAWSTVEYVYSPHSVSECSGFSVSPAWQPGHYQVLMEVSVGHPARARDRWLSAPFEVRKADLGKVHIQILSPGSEVGAGEVVRFRIDNPSAEPISFGEPFGVQGRDRRRWVKASFSPKCPWTEPVRAVLPGGASAIDRFRVPVTASPGRYRIVKHVHGEGRALTLTAEFSVQP
jgi:hypothetical protein